MHRCRWNGCGRAIPETLYMCHLHWFRVPQYLRVALWNGYRQGVLSPQYVATHHQIQDWVREHHGEESNGHRADSFVGDTGG